MGLQPTLETLLGVGHFVVFLAGLYGLLYLWGWQCWHGTPRSQTRDSGTIAPGGISAAITMACSLMIAIVGIFWALGGWLVIGISLAAGGLLLVVYTIPYFTRRLDVTWNSDGIEGPCLGWAPHVRVPRTFISWDEIAAYNALLVQAEDGRRVFWTIHSGSGALVAELRRRRPDLSSPLWFESAGNADHSLK